MTKIQIVGGLQHYFDQQACIYVSAHNLGELIDNIILAYPGCKEQVTQGLSYAIDGKIINDNWLAPIYPHSEVVILPKIIGG